MRIATTLAAALTLAAAHAAHAADPPKAKAPAAAPAAEAAAPATPPPPPQTLAQNLKGLEGKWRCSGAFPDSAFGKAHNVKAELAMKSDLNGYFYVARYEEKKAKDNPTPYVMIENIGFDPSKGELVRTDMDGMGAITHLSSKGFDADNKLVWAGETMAGPQKLPFRETQTKKGDKELTIAMEMAGPDGAFVALGTLTCKK